MKVPPTMLTMPALPLLLVNPMVQAVSVIMVQIPMPSMVPKMETLAQDQALDLGASLRDRAFRCNLRFAPISAAIPRASARLRLAARSACRGGSLRSPPLPDRHARSEVRPHRPPDRRVLLATALCAALVAVLASLALRRLRAAPRLDPAALRASPVSASPSTGSGTAPCTTRRTGVSARARAPAERSRTSLLTGPCNRARTSAGTSASAFGSVRRTTACGSGRTAARSRAAAAPTRRSRRRRFPEP